MELGGDLNLNFQMKEVETVMKHFYFQNTFVFPSLCLVSHRYSFLLSQLPRPQCLIP